MPAPASTANRLKHLRERFEAVEGQLADPGVAKDSKRLSELGREHADLTETIKVAERLADAEDRLAQARDILKTEGDEEMRELAELEAEETEGEVERLTEELEYRLVPRDPLDDRNILLEIRAGTGGDEAGLFAADLLRMYTRYAEERGWKMEMVSETEGAVGGLREVVVNVKGNGAYSRLKYESGVHRVQRVPATETQGRIHTSAATVAVLPEAEETDVEIKETDIRVDTMCASGPGGQGVNTTYSAVRILHLPTGLIVTCQDERSQTRNKAKALTVLRARLLEAQLEKDRAARSAARKSMVGSGDRSERIRTYNFPQNRVTDHRINLTLYSLDRLIEGDIESMISALRKAEMAERMEGMAK
ncbi:MAG: peptide chain release factor 1 [Sumerlaeia bacterium]